MNLDTINIGDGIHIFYHDPTSEWMVATDDQLVAAREIQAGDDDAEMEWWGGVRVASPSEVFEATRPNRGRPLEWITPPAEQGLTVRDSFASDRQSWIYRHRFDASDRTSTYYRAPIENIAGEFEPWNSVPAIDGEWFELEMGDCYGASPRVDR